jgi:DNA uptake protein ComE-like DNA-binding protein
MELSAQSPDSESARNCKSRWARWIALGRGRRRAALVAAGLVAAMVAVPRPALADGGTIGSAAAANLPEVTMICSPEQVNLNSASSAVLQTALGVSRPVADRVVAARPYLQVTDLLAVNGIGPGGLKVILASHKVCAAPSSTPPQVDKPCTDRSVDIQAASASELVAALGVSRSNAEKIVANRPYATLRHLIPERVGGAGKGELDRVVAKSCLTPAPVRTATASYRWAYRSQNTPVARGGATMLVPAGVIDGTGGWASITDAASPFDLDGPTADFHIWVPWQGGSDQVQVALPVSADEAVLPADIYTPVLIHAVGADPIVHHGSAVTVVNGRISTWTSSLSLFVSSPFGISLLHDTDPLVSRGDLVIKAMRAVVGARGSSPTCGPLTSWRSKTAGNAIEHQALPLDRAPLLYCVEDGPGSAGRWRVVNNTGAVLSFNAQGHTRIVDYLLSGDILVDLTFDVWNATTGSQESTSRTEADIPPGGGLVLQVPEGTYDDLVGVGTNELLALPTFLEREIGELVPSTELSKLYAVLNTCGFSPAVSGAGLEAALQCAKTYTLTDDHKPAGTSLSTWASIKKAISIGLFISSAAISAADTITVNLGDWNLSLTWRNPAPPTPSGQPTAGRFGAGNPPPTVRLVKLAGSNASFVRDGDGVAHPVPDGGTYICNTRAMPTQFNVADLGSVAPGGVGSPATCPLNAHRTLTSDTTRGFILRTAAGAAYIVGDNGLREPIPNGASFNCFAANHLVWDYVDENTELPYVAADPSSAGRFCIP